jgi:hypothetical protein
LTTVIKDKVYGYNEEIKETGLGYAITVIYKIKEISTQNYLNLFAQIGGQIFF